MKSHLRGIGVALGFALALLCVLLMIAMIVASPTLARPGERLGVAVLAIGIAFGLWLVRVSRPGLLASLTRRRPPDIRPLFSRAALLHPVGMPLWTIVIGAVLLIPTGSARIVVVLAAFIVYLCAATIALLVQPRWWFRLLMTLLLSPVVMFSLIGVSEAIEKNSVGEGALALVGPLMISWAVLPATGLVRLFRHSLFEQPQPGPTDKSVQS